MLLIVGTIRLPPHQLENARPAMRAMIAASRAEPGCLAYHYALDLDDPGLIHVVERWTDEAALEAHFRTAHLLAWRAQWGELGIHDRHLTLYPENLGRPL